MTKEEIKKELERGARVTGHSTFVDALKLIIEQEKEIARQSCLDYYDMVSYLGNKDGYGWHISDLKIYDKPKELSEFKIGCKGCNERDTYHCKFYCYGERPLTRPPQSYMFVREL